MNIITRFRSPAVVYEYDHAAGEFVLCSRSRTYRMPMSARYFWRHLKAFRWFARRRGDIYTIEQEHT